MLEGRRGVGRRGEGMLGCGECKEMHTEDSPNLLRALSIPFTHSAADSQGFV